MTPPADVLPDLVEEMLLDAGLTQDRPLHAALLSLGSLASLPAPVPSGELAALLAGNSAGPVQDELGRRRGLRAHRPRVLGIALLAGMGMGVGGVAASSTAPGQSGSASIQHMLRDWAPAWSLPAPRAAGSVPSPEPDASLGNTVEPQASGQDALRVDHQAATAPDAANQAGPRGPASAAGPAAPGAGVKVTAPAAGHGVGPGAGQGVVPGLEKGDAGAAAAGVGGVARPVDPATVQGGGSDAPGKVLDAVQGSVSGVVDGTLQATADTADAALTSIPGTSWLQKFKR